MTRDNYEYWQQSGEGWYEEYQRRRRILPYFRYQEIYLTEYVSRFRPAKVLEFGCGVGRHLKNLVKVIPDTVFGFDQSPTMVAEMLYWADDNWFHGHVKVGEPVGRLPYDDGEFDFVYTSEVLVHVHPDDIQGILKELLRVCRGTILHLEPGVGTPLESTAHNGCWYHDLRSLYQALGYQAHTFDKMFDVHDITALSTDSTSPPQEVFGSVTSTLFLDMEQAFIPALLHSNDTSKNDHYNETLYLKEHIAFLELARLSALPTPQQIRITVLGDETGEAWIRWIKPSTNGPMMPWSELGDLPPGWVLREAVGCNYDLALYGKGGSIIEFTGWLGTQISVMGHGFSSGIQVESENGPKKEFDLYRDNSEIVEINID